MIYLLIVLFGVVLLDGLNRLLIELAYIHLPTDSELSRRQEYVTACDAELMILGASRGVYDYNTQMLSDSLHLSCKSISKEGMSVVSQFVSVKKAIEHGKTKIIIYDLSIAQLADDWVENQTSVYYPFYWKNEDVKSFVERQQGKKMRLLLSSSFIQYNSLLYDLLYYGFVLKTNDKNGFVALPYTGKPFAPKTEDFLEEPIRINPTGEDYLQRIIDVCKDNSIRLILCDSPRVNNKNQDIDKYLEIIAAENQLDFWNYSDFEPVCSDMRYFVDPVHINGLGANLFTQEIINRLREF